MSAGNSTDPQSSVGGVPAIIRLQDAAGNVISDAHPLPVSATITATAETTFEATAAAPTYTEGQDAPGSQDLSGNLRVRLPLVGSTKVSGIQEVDTWLSRTADYTITAGALSWAFAPAADFVGTVNGVAWSGSSGSELFQGAASRESKDGNTCPAAVFTRSAGTYLTAEARPS